MQRVFKENLKDGPEDVECNDRGHASPKERAKRRQVAGFEKARDQRAVGAHDERVEGELGRLQRGVALALRGGE